MYYTYNIPTSAFWVFLFLVEIFIKSIFGIGLISVGDTLEHFLIGCFGVDNVLVILDCNIWLHVSIVDSTIDSKLLVSDVGTTLDSKLLSFNVGMLIEFSIGLSVTVAGANSSSLNILGLKCHIPEDLNPLTALWGVAPF